MNSNGDLYVPQAMKDSMEKTLRERVSGVGEEGLPKDADLAVSAEMVPGLAGLNRRQRRTFYAERRAGKDEGEALDLARGAL